MYLPLLTIHSLLRWVVIILGLIVVARSLRGRFSFGWWGRADARAGLIYTVSLDLQVLVGFLIYLLFSPLTIGAIRNLDVAMADRTLRFWTIEHGTLMILALVLAHVGRARIRSATEDRHRYGRAALYYTLSWLLVLAGTPWPFLSVGRPLLRW
jgi:hypothetical protein